MRTRDRESSVPALRRVFTALISLALLAGACTGSGGSNDGAGATTTEPAADATTEVASGFATESTGGGAQQEELPAEVIAALETVPDYPLLSQLEANPAQAGSGDRVAITGHPKLSGVVSFTGPGGIESVQLTDGAGEVGLPADVEPGVYILKLENEDGAVAYGRLRIAAAPGLWITANRRFVRAGAPLEFEVEAFGLPLDAPAALMIEAAPGVAKAFAPGPDGTVGPATSFGRFDATLGDFLEGSWRLPDGLGGGVNVSLMLEDMTASNVVTLEECSAGGSISGTVDGPAVVVTLWLDDGLQSDVAVTDGGDYLLRAGPGAVVVRTLRWVGDQQMEAESTVVEVPCGETTTLAAAPSAVQAALITSSVGFLEASSSFREASSRRAFAFAQAAGGADDEKCRRALVLASGPVSENILEGLTHIVKSSVEDAVPKLAILTAVDMTTLVDQARQEQEFGSEERAAAALAQAGGADFILRVSVHEWPRTDRPSRYQIFITLIDTARATSLASVEIGPDEDLLKLARRIPREIGPIRRALTKAAICGEVTPEKAALKDGESKTFAYEVKTLDGEAVSGAEVKVADRVDGEFDEDCGEFDRTEGTTASPFVAEFTAADEPPEPCSEYPRFTARWNGPTGTVSTDPSREKADAQIDVEREFDFTMVVEMRDERGYMLTFTTTGAFVAKEEGFIAGAGDGVLAGGSECIEIVNGAEVSHGDIPISGSWSALVGGYVRGRGDAAKFHLKFFGVDWSLLWDVPALCTTLGFAEAAGNLLRLVALQPDDLVFGGIEIQPVLGEKWIFFVEGLGNITVVLEERP